MIRDNYRSNPIINSGAEGSGYGKNVAVTLESVVGQREIIKQEDLGLIQIPVNRIIGYIANGEKIHKTDSYLHCCEYLGNFYIYGTAAQVSMINSSGSFVLHAYVTRLIPAYSEEKHIMAYYDFLAYYPFTGMYQIQFTQAGFFEKFQNALGHDVNHKWSIADRGRFLMKWYVIESAFNRAFVQKINLTAADAFVVLLENHSYSQISNMPSWVLTRVFQTEWKKLHILGMRIEDASLVTVGAYPFLK